MSKPNIYAHCNAGCSWETVHKSDFDAIAGATKVATGLYMGLGGNEDVYFETGFTPKLVIIQESPFDMDTFEPYGNSKTTVINSGYNIVPEHSSTPLPALTFGEKGFTVNCCTYMGDDDGDYEFSPFYNYGVGYRYTAIGGENADAVTLSKPTFDLAEMGLPNVPYGSSATLQTDVTEITSAFEKGAVTFKFNVEFEDGVRPYVVTMLSHSTVNNAVQAFKVLSRTNTAFSYAMIAIIENTIIVSAAYQTINAKELPSVTSKDDGKVLMVSGGAWIAGEIPTYDGTTTIE